MLIKSSVSGSYLYSSDGEIQNKSIDDVVETDDEENYVDEDFRRNIIN